MQALRVYEVCLVCPWQLEGISLTIRWETNVRQILALYFDAASAFATCVSVCTCVCLDWILACKILWIYGVQFKDRKVVTNMQCMNAVPVLLKRLMFLIVLVVIKILLHLFCGKSDFWYLLIILNSLSGWSGGVHLIFCTFWDLQLLWIGANCGSHHTTLLSTILYNTTCGIKWWSMIYLHFLQISRIIESPKSFSGYHLSAIFTILKTFTINNIVYFQ